MPVLSEVRVAKYLRPGGRMRMVTLSFPAKLRHSNANGTSRSSAAPASRPSELRPSVLASCSLRSSRSNTVAPACRASHAAVFISGRSNNGARNISRIANSVRRARSRSSGGGSWKCCTDSNTGAAYNSIRANVYVSIELGGFVPPPHSRRVFPAVTEVNS